METQQKGTTFTHDIKPGEIDALLDRLRSCDGNKFDASVIVWEHCQALAAEIESLRGEADLYRRGYKAIGACDISHYLALCEMGSDFFEAMPKHLQAALVEAFREMDLIGAEHPEDCCRWSAESLAEQLAPVLAEKLARRVE